MGEETILKRFKTWYFQTKRKIVDKIFGKYTWSCRKFWWYWICKDIMTFIYKYWYKINITNYGDGSCFPRLGKGEFYSIYRKGDIIQIIKEKEDKNNKEFDEIRIIPSKSAQGFQVELFKDNSIICRTHMDVNHLIGYCLNNKINERLG